MPEQYPPVPAPTDQVYLGVRTDQAAIRRWHGTVLAVHAALVALVMILTLWMVAAAGEYLEWYAFLMPFVALAGGFFQIGWLCYAWGARTAIARPITVSTAGLELNTMAGRVRLPWDAVESVTRRLAPSGQLLVFKAWPNAVPGAPGLEIDVPAPTWNRFRQRGIALGGRGLQPGVEEILAAVHAASGGRVRIH